MSIGEERFEELSQAAIQLAMDKLNKHGAPGLTICESQMLQLGVVCGIEAVVQKLVDADALDHVRPHDHFAA